jgi:hypothetical protein
MEAERNDNVNVAREEVMQLDTLMTITVSVIPPKVIGGAGKMFVGRLSTRMPNEIKAQVLMAVLEHCAAEMSQMGIKLEGQ